MRYGMAVVCLMAAGCASENELRFTSTLQAETNGVALSENGLDMYAAMSGTTCTIDANWGCPTSDADLPTTSEKVTDHWNGQTLGISSEGVHHIDQHVDEQIWNQDADEIIDSVRTANLTESGEVIVRGDEEGCFVEREGESMEVSGDLCADGVKFSVDRTTGSLFAASQARVVELGTDSEADIGQGDLADFDPSLRYVYTATQGDDVLRAFNLQHAEMWEVTVGGPIHSLTARGDRGEVMVLVERQGLAAVERRDGENGKLLAKSIVPTSDGDLESSNNGHTIAVVRGGEVNFFALDDGMDPVIDETPPHCIVPTVNGQEINLGD